MMGGLLSSGLKDNGPNVRGEIIEDSLNGLNGHEFSKMNRILDEEYKKKQATILDKTFGEVINNTVNFFSNSFDIYNTKLMEAEFTGKLYDTEHPYLNTLQTHLVAIVLFIRDEENIIYMGIIMIILSVLISFFNISRSYGYTETGGTNTK